MRHIYYELDIGFEGCGEEGVMAIPDRMTRQEVDEMVNEMAHEHANSWEGDTRLGFDEDASEEEYEQQVEDFRQNISGYWRWATEEDIENYG